MIYVCLYARSIMMHPNRNGNSIRYLDIACSIPMCSDKTCSSLGSHSSHLETPIDNWKVVHFLISSQSVTILPTTTVESLKARTAISQFNCLSLKWINVKASQRHFRFLNRLHLTYEFSVICIQWPFWDFLSPEWKFHSLRGDNNWGLPIISFSEIVSQSIYFSILSISHPLTESGKIFGIFLKCNSLNNVSIQCP